MALAAAPGGTREPLCRVDNPVGRSQNPQKPEQGADLRGTKGQGLGHTRCPNLLSWLRSGLRESIR